MDVLKYRWLGSPQIERGDFLLPMPTRKATAILAFLAAHNQPISRERLAAMFWAEYDQVRSFANLRRTLVSIRQILGADSLISSRDLISLNPNLPIWSDTEEFTHLIRKTKEHHHTESLCNNCIAELEKALALYRGDFLDGLILKDSPDFEDWQRLQGETYRAELGKVLEELCDAYSDRREWDQAILKGRQWVNMDRLHEPAQRKLILAYARSGQRSLAIRQYEDCKHWLELDLGQSPDEETSLIYEQVKKGDLDYNAPARPTEKVPTPGGHPYPPVIRSKLFIPRCPAHMVTRQHLISKLEQGAQRTLTLISAPAGYGKTTLLSEWIEILQKTEPSPFWTVCWFSLDAEDNDPARFLTYLSAALEKAQPGFVSKASAFLRVSNSDHPETPLSMLVNDLQELDRPVLLVVDDYQFISNQAIHDGISFLLDHMPDSVHVVIVTRSDPPIPLARLRACNQLLEIRAHDLRFSALEISQFMNKGFQLALTPEHLQTLEDRTEGWIAGLQLAAISMQGRYDLAQFIEAFSGSQKFIMDYLTEEALTRLSREVQVFLLQTSILERLSESLCDFVLEQNQDQTVSVSISGSAGEIFQNDKLSLLAELERSNLFIVPLDDERKWYRYHHLFADLLRSRLAQAFPTLVPILHGRASIWFERNGFIEESIQHALAARDWMNASRLITVHIRSYLENGQMTTVMKWIGKLPIEELYQSPMLCLHVAELYSQAGMIDQIDPFLEAAEDGIVRRQQAQLGEGNYAGILSSKEITITRSMSATLRGLKAVCADQPQHAIDITGRALQEYPNMELEELATLFWVQGWAYRSLGNLPEALAALTQATDYAGRSKTLLRDIWTDLGNVTRLTGKLQQASDIFTHSLRAASARGLPDQGNLSRDETFLSLVLFEQNQLDLAFSYINRAIEHTKWWPSHNIIALAYTNLARILLAWGDHEECVSALNKADHERQNRLMTPFVHGFVETTWVEVWLKQGAWDLLDTWVEKQSTFVNTKMEMAEKIDEYGEMRLIMLARIWIEFIKHNPGSNRHQNCRQLLERLAENCKTAGRFNSLVSILFLISVLQKLLGNNGDAMDTLDACLEIAEPGGYMRIFLQIGDTGLALIQAYTKQSDAKHQVYALQILRAFDSIKPVKNQIAGSPESLTSREQEVLQLVAEGCSNRQIAEKLVLSEGTVKFHVHHLLNKLQVDNRTHAIVRAKELNLIQ